jgi:protease IV
MEDNISPPPAAPPPPLSPPPVIVPPAQPAPRRGGRGWMIFALILLVLLVISLMSNLGHMASALVGGKAVRAHTAGPRLDEVLTEDNDASDKIAVIEISGIISSHLGDQGGYNLVDVVRAQLKHAEEDHHVKAVILKVDSPGGEVLASDEIYHAVADFQTKSRKAVIGSMGNVAASGGYYVSAPCRWIVANDMTITGSIGVIMHSWNYRGLMNKVGLRPETYKSGKHKDMLSGERELSEIPADEREMLQSLITETYEKFKSIVVEGRQQAQKSNKGEGRALDAKWSDYADGRVLSGAQAWKLGFVDQLGNFQDAVNRAKSIAGIPAANLIEYHVRYDLSDLFRLFGQTESRSRVIKVDLGMEPPKLQVGQLYFLSPTVAP